MTIQDLHFDCIHFRGDMPCRPNKESGKVCDTCTEYQPISKRILIIKLGALGDVIRTTPLLERYRKEYPHCHITWITNFPEILPKDALDCIRTFTFSDVFIVTKQQFDIAVNLCKDEEAAMLLAECNAKHKFGFIWSEGHLSIANPESEHKLLTGYLILIQRQIQRVMWKRFSKSVASIISKNHICSMWIPNKWTTGLISRNRPKTNPSSDSIQAQDLAGQLDFGPNRIGNS